MVFKITDDCFRYREISFCTFDGRHHTVLSYSPGHDLSAWSDETQKNFADQKQTIHGLKYDDPSSRDQPFVSANVKKWYKTHCSSDCPAVGLLGVTPQDNLFQTLNIPIIHIPIRLQEVRKVPIGTINVMKPCDDRHWCTNHGNGRLPVWHDCCARVMACKLSWWLRRELNVQPTVQEVNLNAFCGRNDAMNCCIGSYVTIALKKKMTLLQGG